MKKLKGFRCCRRRLLPVSSSSHMKLRQMALTSSFVMVSTSAAKLISLVVSTSPFRPRIKRRPSSKLSGKENGRLGRI